MKWTVDKDDFLKEHKDDSYGVLSSELGCSIRAVKHRVGAVGLGR